MKLRTLFLCALTAGLAHAGAAPADFTPIDIKLDEKEIGTIEVGGAHLDAYREVVTKMVSYSLWARGDTPTSQGDTVSTFLLQAIEDGGWVAKYEGPLYEDWNKYRISFPYQDIVMKDSGRHLAPVNRCNERRLQTTGEARKDFLFKGTTISVHNAYRFRGYVPKGDGGDVDWLYAPVTIKCLPLDHDPQRVKLRIEPAKLEKLGKFVCPMELRLHGAVESREKFIGKSIFIGPHYLSAITDLNYTKAGNRNVGATYKIKWQQMGGLATAPNQEPKKQDLTFRFNVSDQTNKVVETVEERVQVSCRKIKSNAPTTSGDMTINPAN